MSNRQSRRNIQFTTEALAFTRGVTVANRRIQRTLEALERIEKHTHEVYVRDVVNGVLDNYLLTELPAKVAIEHVCRMIRKQLEGTE